MISPPISSLYAKLTICRLQPHIWKDKNGARPLYLSSNQIDDNNSAYFPKKVKLPYSDFVEELGHMLAKNCIDKQY